MKNTRENDKKWIEALQERNRVLEEVLALTQLENKELTEQLRIADVVKSLPQNNYCDVCNLPTNIEKCYSKRCPV